MCDTKFSFPQPSNRIIGHIVIPVVIGYFSWKIISRFLLSKEESSPKAGQSCSVSILVFPYCIKVIASDLVHFVRSLTNIPSLTNINI